jgi:hypothetical protein
LSGPASQPTTALRSRDGSERGASSLEAATDTIDYVVTDPAGLIATSTAFIIDASGIPPVPDYYETTTNPHLMAAASAVAPPLGSESAECYAFCQRPSESW